MSKLPENCPVCGEKMEKGTLRASGRGVEIAWGPPDMNFWRRGEVIGSGGLFGTGGFFTINLVAHRCPNCKMVLFSYEKGKKEE